VGRTANLWMLSQEKITGDVIMSDQDREYIKDNNLYNKDHKTTNPCYRDNYDKIKWNDKDKDQTTITIPQDMEEILSKLGMGRATLYYQNILYNYITTYINNNTITI